MIVNQQNSAGLAKLHRRNLLLLNLLGACLALALRPGSALAFPYVVQPGETLAAIAQRLYGRADREALLVTANGLALDGGVPIVPGMRLEVPAVSHRRTTRADSWPALATELLGAPERAGVLAFANESKPWERPADGAEIIVPYNLRIIAGNGETLNDVALRFLGDKKRTWMLAQYNGMQDVRLERGQVVLVPLTDLPLTPEGRREAQRAAGVQSGLGGEQRALQSQAASELPELLGDVRYGRYVEAVARGERLLAGRALSAPQRAVVHRQLLEAYAALGLTGRAADECQAWRRYAPGVRLSPAQLSPKLLAACTRPSAAATQPSTP
jgi:hypothetical protein